MRSIQLAQLVGCSGIALAVLVCSAPAARAAGDAAAGKAISVACQACHVAVDPKGDTPGLVGQRENYIAKQLKAFKSGDRKNDLMSAVATQLSEADIANLAAYWASQPAGSDATVPEDVAAIKKPNMTIPKDFPKGFVLYLSENKTEQPDKPTVSRSYINNVGFQAVKASKPLPDGSAIIVANYTAKLDASKKPIVEKDGSWAVDKLTSFAGMEARAGWGKAIPELLRNANWNYGVFAADRTLRPVNQALCLACHKPKASTSYVFLMKDIETKARGGAK